MAKRFHANFTEANADLPSTGRRLAQRHGRFSEAPRRLWIYLACLSVFCLGLFSLAATLRASRFVAAAAIYSTNGQAFDRVQNVREQDAGEKLASTFSRPAPWHADGRLMAKLPQAILRHVIETESLATDPEFSARQWNWITRIGLVFGWTDVASQVQAGRDHVLIALEQAITVKAPTSVDRLGLDGSGINTSDGSRDVSQSSLPLDHNEVPELTIEVASQEAGKAARIANALATALVDAQKASEKEKEAHRQRMADDASSFAERLRFAKQHLADFRSIESQHDVTGLAMPHGNAGHPITLAEAQADAQSISRAIASGDTSGPSGLHFETPELDRLQSEYSNLNQLFQKRKLSLGEKHPELLALEGQLHAAQMDLHRQWLKAADIANRNYRMAQSHAQTFSHATASTEDGADFASADLAKLQSDVDVARHDYEHALTLQVKAEQAIDQQPAWSIAPAKAPESPTHKPHGFIAGAALILGAMFGAGRALTESRRDQRHRPLPRKQGASRILAVPRIKRSWFADALRMKPELDVACREVLDQPRSEFSRMIESLCELEARSRSRGMVKILFLSEQDGLGATTLAVNFAQMAAKDGDRVLLIEANRSNPVLASLISPNVHVDLIDLMGVERIICHLRKDLSIIPILDEETSDILGDRAQRCIEGLAGNFDLVVIDGGTFNDQDDELLEMADAVNRVFHLTPEGIEMKANINSSKIKR
jgi:hypothetical protein